VSVYYFDSSGIVKRYTREIGTDWVLGITDVQAGNSIYMARITGVEVLAAITRQVRVGSISQSDAAKAIAQFRHDFATQYYTVDATPKVIGTAMTLVEKHQLRGYDAVQLATALEVNAQSLAAGLPSLGVPALIMITADADLNTASTAEGLTVDDPMNHP